MDNVNAKHLVYQKLAEIWLELTSAIAAPENKHK